MSTPDAPTIDALGQQVVRPAFLAWLDFDGDPIRATTWEVSLQPSGTGDPDLDGQQFLAVSPQFGGVSPVKRQTGGSDTVNVWLSGIVGPDSGLLDILGDETKWKGRRARLWYVVKNEDGSNVGAYVPYFKGRMVDYSIEPTATMSKATVMIETYLAILTDASNMTYLNQADFDPGDTSASLTIAVANGARTAAQNAGISAATDYAGRYADGSMI